MPSIADAVTVARMPLALALAGVAVLDDDPSRLALTVLYLAGVVTDVIDGPLARRAGTAGPRGARLDSIADVVFTGGTIAALVGGVRLPDAAWVWWGFAVVVAGRVAVAALTYVRFRVMSMMHTAANRASGVTVAAVALLGFSTGTLPAWGFACAGGVAVVAIVDEAVAVLTSDRYDRDGRGRLARR